MTGRFLATFVQIVILAAATDAWAGTGIDSPLRVHPDNPRYVTDDSGRAILLAGSHTWRSVQEATTRFPPETEFDFGEFLDLLEKENHNFTRLWAWESAAWVQPKSIKLWIDPLPFERTGLGNAADGRPKFDVTRLNQAYFDRLRSRVQAASDRGIYVGVMLFQGFSVARKSRGRDPSPWAYHPLNGANNVNGIDGDLNGDGEGYEVHELGVPAVTRIQESYVRKVVDSVCDLDNVIYEISNESHGDSTAWQYHMIDVIRQREKIKGKKHLVWMTFQWDGMAGPGTNDDLFSSTAEVVSPGSASGGKKKAYEIDPPAATGAKVVVADTDHVNPPNMDRADWVWKCFTRGLHPIFMDNPPIRGNVRHPVLDDWTPVGPSARTRTAMGHVVALSRKLDLAAMVPTDDKAECSTRYCLREPGAQYVAYQPTQGPMTLRVKSGVYDVEWLDPETGRSVEKKSLEFSGGAHSFESPLKGEAVLCLIAKPQTDLRSQLRTLLHLGQHLLIAMAFFVGLETDVVELWGALAK